MAHVVCLWLVGAKSLGVVLTTGMLGGLRGVIDWCDCGQQQLKSDKSVAYTRACSGWVCLRVGHWCHLIAEIFFWRGVGLGGGRCWEGCAYTHMHIHTRTHTHTHTHTCTHTHTLHARMHTHTHTHTHTHAHMHARTHTHHTHTCMHAHTLHAHTRTHARTHARTHTQTHTHTLTHSPNY